ncbi:MAG TPA: SusC/RagA family TonB-linked outer membrane protein [Flavisolibacter sp.]|jgi:TonB-linked SusC/RagA family outer membrane protein|nr:SusC/RagA family TonB-linked outer membrane protein [Flavisolibacter sp.]
MSALYMKKYILSTVATLLLLWQVTSAQEVNNTTATVRVTGSVLDDFGKPLSGVTVNRKGTQLSTETDKTGVFQLEAPLQSSLQFSHPLFNVAEVRVKNASELTVKLSKRYLHQLDAVNNNVTTTDTSEILLNRKQRLNVLYGEKSRADVLGSYASIYSTQLNTTPASTYLYALPGRLPGLNVIQNRGFYVPQTSSLTDVDIFVGNIPKNNSGAGPSDNTEFTIQLRGHAGSAGQGPVTVVDGVQRDYFSLDPHSIESVTIAKDALSSILLGQNSSRGALIVTTKRPEAGAPRLSYTAETGLQSPLGFQNPLPAYQYAYLLNEALLNDGKQPAYTAADFAAFRDGTDPTRHPDVNWYNTILRENSRLTRHNLNVTGGGNLARYMVSLNYMDQQGLFVTDPANTYNTNAQLKRYVINSKVEVDVNRNFNIGLQLFGRLQEGNQPGATTQTILNGLLSTPSNAYPVYNPNGSFGGTNNYTQNLLAQTISSGYQADNTRDVMANLDLSYKLDDYIKGLWFNAKGNVSVNSASNINRSKQVPVFTMALSPAGDTSYNRQGNTVNQRNDFTTTAWARYWFAQLSAGYDRQFGQHKVSGQLLYDQKKVLLNYDIPSRLTNYAGKAAYSFGGKYFAEAALVYSGYDRYRPDHQYGLFYAAGLGWDLAKERFLQGQQSWLNQFKLRATYGKTGNANVDNYGYYIWRSYYVGVAGWYPIGSSYPNGIGMAEGGQPGSQTLANIVATWEKANKLNVGLDVSVWKNHLQFTADYYNERYFDVMQQRGKTIALIGINYPAENIGINRFTGVEASLTYQNNFKNFNYFITANAAVQQSKVLFKDEQARAYSWNVETGHPVGQRFGLIADGFFQSDAEAKAAPTITGYTPLAGDFRYRDLNSDGIIDQFDVTALGRERPLIYYGMTLGFDFKGIEFSALIQGVQNREIYVNNGIVDAGFQGQNNGYSQAYQQALGRWVPENAGGAMYPRLTAGGSGYNYSPLFSSNSAFLKNGNYLRVKNVHLAYSLPYNWIKRLKLANIKFFVNAQNLYTWGAYGVIDPEVSLPNYPIQRVINTGLTIQL